MREHTAPNCSLKVYATPMNSQWTLAHMSANAAGTMLSEQTVEPAK